jgi:hypothetical protein
MQNENQAMLANLNYSSSPVNIPIQTSLGNTGNVIDFVNYECERMNILEEAKDN